MNLLLSRLRGPAPDPRAARERFFILLSSLACAATPAMALVAPSGYSCGAALLFAGVLLSLRHWRRPLLPPGPWVWVLASFAVMGASWQLDSLLSHAGLRGADKPAKYLLAMLCLVFVARYPPRARWLWAGTALGAIGGGGVAIAQWLIAPSVAAGRADGFTNAIQFGGLCLVMAVACGIGLAVPAPWQRSRCWRALLALGVALGTCGSLLSQSRGGWLALAVVLPVLAIAARRHLDARRLAAGIAVLAASIAFAWWTPSVGLRERVDLAREEVRLYQTQHDAVTSVGQRLEHWRLAWRLGTERPLLGWTQRGYTQEKQRLVDAGLFDPFILQFNHAHNEFLDVFAKRGLVGLGALLFLYGVPLVLFWPRRARRIGGGGKSGSSEHDRHGDQDTRGLRLAALTVPLAYIGFGLTQGFVGHNSGTMFFLFMTLALHGCLWGARPVDYSRGNGLPALV